MSDSPKPKQFEKRANAYIGYATCIQSEDGDEVIIMAANVDALVRAASQATCLPIDTSLVQQVALIAASRVSKTGHIAAVRADEETK